MAPASARTPARRGVSRVASALLLASHVSQAAALLGTPPPAAALTPGGEAAETLTFFATADWGGQEEVRAVGRPPALVQLHQT